MYDKIGGKIKMLAKVLFFVASAIEVILGIVLMVVDTDLIPFGLLAMLGGPVVTWIASWVIYGFGELIEKVSDIERNTRSGGSSFEAQAKADSEEK